MKLSTKYYLAWLFILAILILLEPSTSKDFLYLFLSWSAIIYGRLMAKPWVPKADIILEKPKGRWD